MNARFRLSLLALLFLGAACSSDVTVFGDGAPLPEGDAGGGTGAADIGAPATDGGAPDAGGQWNCNSASVDVEASHGAPCAFESTSCFTAGPQPEGEGTFSMCRDGEIIAGTYAPAVDADEMNACPENNLDAPLVAGSRDRLYFGGSDDGCARVAACESGSSGRTREVCSAAHDQGLRDDAVIFDDCEAALAAGRDRDACGGSFFCAGKSLDATAPVVVWCDAGVLRIVPARSVVVEP